MKFLLVFLCTFSVAAAMPQCLSVATLNATAKTCDCPPGQHGVGDFCCADLSQNMCMIKGDPIITSFFDERFLADFPCGQFILQRVETTLSDRCRVRVMTNGDIAKNGFIYSSRIGVSISVSPIVSVSLTQRKSGTIYMWDHWFKHPKTGDIVDILEAPGSYTFQFKGRNIRLSYDLTDKIFIVDACGLTVRFKPASDVAGIQTSGLCLLTSGDISPLAIRSPVCSVTPGLDFGLFRSLSEHLLPVLIDTAADLLGEADLNMLEVQGTRSVCDSIRACMSACTPLQRPEVMKECANILTNPMVRFCLVLRKSDLRVVFRDCIHSYCSGVQAACDRLKSDRGIQTCFHSALKCDIWTGNI